MQHEILETETQTMCCLAKGSFDQRKTWNPQHSNNKWKTGVRFSFTRSAIYVRWEMSVIVLPFLFSLQSTPYPAYNWSSSVHIYIYIQKKDNKNKFAYLSLLPVPTAHRICIACVCVFVSCVWMLMCWLVLQALVEVDGGGVGTVLSYALLQVLLQPAHTHGAAKRWLNMIRNAADMLDSTACTSLTAFSSEESACVRGCLYLFCGKRAQHKGVANTRLRNKRCRREVLDGVTHLCKGQIIESIVCHLLTTNRRAPPGPERWELETATGRKSQVQHCLRGYNNVCVTCEKKQGPFQPHTKRTKQTLLTHWQKTTTKGWEPCMQPPYLQEGFLLQWIHYYRGNGCKRKT